jgi:hypothetical protein
MYISCSFTPAAKALLIDSIRVVLNPSTDSGVANRQRLTEMVKLLTRNALNLSQLVRILRL